MTIAAANDTVTYKSARGDADTVRPADLVVAVNPDGTNIGAGVSATSLGKAEDAAHASGDTGVMALAVRNDGAATSFGANGDYSPAAVDLAGRLMVDGPVSVARLVSAAATTNATSVKASAGIGFSLIGYNAAAALRYLKLYDKASAPTVGTDTPYVTITLPSAAAFDIPMHRLRFAIGIAYAFTTGSADADTGALTAGDITGFNLSYA